MIPNLMTAINGVFIPVLSVDYLVVAGGAGGGFGAAGGGGAGGYRYFTAQTLTKATNYTVQVGGGGTAGTSGVAAGSGTNSIFSTTTSILMSFFTFTTSTFPNVFSYSFPNNNCV